MTVNPKLENAELQKTLIKRPVQVCSEWVRWIYQAALQDLGPLQCHCDAVGEDEDQHHVVKELMGYDGLAHLAEPAGGGQNISKQEEPTRLSQDSQTVYRRGGGHPRSALVYIFSNSKQIALTALSEEQDSRVRPDRKMER